MLKNVSGSKQNQTEKTKNIHFRFRLDSKIGRSYIKKNCTEQFQVLEAKSGFHLSATFNVNTNVYTNDISKEIKIFYCHRTCVSMDPHYIDASFYVYICTRAVIASINKAASQIAFLSKSTLSQIFLLSRYVR